MPDNIYEINDKGQQHGRYISYYSNGNIMHKGHFKNDFAHGLWEYFYQDSTLMHKGEYINGTMIGYWIESPNAGFEYTYSFYAR